MNDHPLSTGSGERELLNRDEARSLASSLSALLDSAPAVLRSDQSAALQRISDHLGVDARQATVVGHHWPTWDHVSVHRGVAAHLAAVSPQAQWFGLSGTQMRMHNDLTVLLQQEQVGVRPSSADFVMLPSGPDSTEEVVSFGLVGTAAVDGTPVVLAGKAIVPADLEPVVTATEGATASAMKELMRRAVLRALEQEPDVDPPVLDDEVMASVIAEFGSEAQALSRSLLGAGATADPKRAEHQRDL